MTNNKRVKNNILSNLQSGFRKSHSTTTALTKLCDHLLNNINDKQISMALLIDLRKAFDTVQHQLLITKLKGLGLNKLALEWMTSYLHNRTQAVTIQGHLSDPLCVKMGIPQGSILGPLLFLIFINDFPNILDSSTAHMYADDTTVVVSGRDITTVSRTMNNQLTKIKIWLDNNKLIMNKEKTNILLFGSTHKLSKINKKDININIEGTRLNIINSGKILGITLDENLSFKPHITNLCKKLSRKIGVLKQLKSTLPLRHLRLIYNATIQPQLDYCDVVWGTAGPARISKLFSLQKRALRLISGAHYKDDATPLFLRQNMLPLEKSIKLHAAVFVFKTLQCHHPTYINDIFKPQKNAHSRNTRASLTNKIIVPRPNCELYRQSMAYFGASLWNFLPDIIRNSSSLNILKNVLNHIFDV